MTEAIRFSPAKSRLKPYRVSTFVNFFAIQYANRQLKTAFAFDTSKNVMAVVMKSRIELSGQTAIVTGGTRGLGRDIAARLAESGCSVFICGRNAPESLPDGVTFESCDIRDADQAKAFVDKVAAKTGRIDILVNNAGGSPPHEASTASSRFAEAIVRLNMLGPLYMSQAAYPYMAKAGSGSIVNIASVSGARPSPDTAIYGAAKAGLINLTQSLAQEWGREGIRVNAIIAGLMTTENAEATYGDAKAQANVGASMPLGRMGTGDDLAGAVLWLCSDLAQWVSGARLQVDGGGERPYFLDLVKGA
jgi:NAD(P)-dependent dehydrogenase (short-subunit alcohol dehydrogenase family)